MRFISSFLHPSSLISSSSFLVHSLFSSLFPLLRRSLFSSSFGFSLFPFLWRYHHLISFLVFRFFPLFRFPRSPSATSCSSPSLLVPHLSSVVHPPPNTISSFLLPLSLLSFHLTPLPFPHILANPPSSRFHGKDRQMIMETHNGISTSGREHHSSSRIFLTRGSNTSHFTSKILGMERRMVVGSPLMVSFIEQKLTN